MGGNDYIFREGPTKDFKKAIPPTPSSHFLRPHGMLAATVLCLFLVGTSLQWAFHPSDFSPNSLDYQEKRPSRPVEESAPVVGYIANPFVSPLTRKWRKLRSRRDFEQ